MTPTQTLLNALQALLATDVTALGSVTAMKVHLIMAPFVPGSLTDLASLTEATFTGHTALTAGAAPQQIFTDPETGNLVAQVKEPAGGWTWIASDAVNLPQTIYGWVLTNGAGSVTLGSELFDTPRLLNAALQAINIPFVRYEFLPPTLV